MFLYQPCKAFYMIGMFMRNKNSFHFIHRKVELLHALLCFPATKACIYQYRFGIVTYVITITIAARI